MNKLIIAVAVAAALGLAGNAFAQSGTLGKAVGGYSFDDAAKESPDTKNFHSHKGKLTFAIITHTAGNGFFDPVYVGAKVAADAFGINLVMLGSEAPVDDIPREIAIINQIINDPTIDGVIMTTPQSGAYDDIVKKLKSHGVPIATTNSFDPNLYRPQLDLAHRPVRGGRGRRRRGVGEVRDRQGRQERHHRVPEHHDARQR